MHGPDQHHRYAGSYSGTDLRWQASRIQEWDAAGKDVFVYFNNDGNANAVRNARTLGMFFSPCSLRLCRDDDRAQAAWSVSVRALRGCQPSH